MCKRWNIETNKKKEKKSQETTKSYKKDDDDLLDCKINDQTKNVSNVSSLLIFTSSLISIN